MGLKTAGHVGWGMYHSVTHSITKCCLGLCFGDVLEAQIQDVYYLQVPSNKLHTSDIYIYAVGRTQYAVAAFHRLNMRVCFSFSPSCVLMQRD